MMNHKFSILSLLKLPFISLMENDGGIPGIPRHFNKGVGGFSGFNPELLRIEHPCVGPNVRRPTGLGFRIGFVRGVPKTSCFPNKHDMF